jgi:D-tagatose-1,6-bisphosphate aldolase subunit GatZ/KbaZ
MACSGDPEPLPEAEIVRRAVRLCKAAEAAHARAGGEAPVYVIGTEVPVPGGEASLAGGLAVTTPQAAEQTLAIHREAFAAPDLAPAWERVIAMVVQPGVDFDHSSVHDYDPVAAQALADFLERQPRIVFEAHSTDYQREDGLHALVRDHFAILKVGPAATFAYREALFALAAIESELLPPQQRSNLPQALEQCMLGNPRHWRQHYHGDERELHLLRLYALSDRCRYYWGEPALIAAVQRLFDNLRAHAPPLFLLSQHLPEQYRAVRAGTLANTPEALVRHRIGLCLDEYARACNRNRAGANNETSRATELSER